MAGAGAFEHGGADPEAALGQREEIDAADDDVAAEFGRVDDITPEQGGDHGEVFVLDQGHLAAPGTAGVVITGDTAGGVEGQRGAGRERCTPRRAGTEPGHPPAPRQAVEQFGKGRRQGATPAAQAFRARAFFFAAGFFFAVVPRTAL
jgi:hypothetical protein